MFVGVFQFPNLSRCTSVYLIKYIASRLRSTDAREDIIRDRDPVCDVWIASIDDLEQEIARERFFEGGGKCINKLRREVTDKSYRIIDEDIWSLDKSPVCICVRTLWELESADSRPERREEFVFFIDSLVCESIHEC